MISILLNTFLILCLFIPFGIFLTNREDNNFYFFSKLIINSVIIICFLALFINFFFPISKFITTILLIIPAVIIIKYKKIFINKNFLIFVSLSTIIIFFLILESDVYRPDAGLYHLPYIKILNEEKIILGLSNLHFRYGHTSIIQYFSAFSNNFIFGPNGIIFAQAIVACGLILNFISQIYNYNKNRNYNLHFFYLLFVSIYIFYKMNRYSEYGNDAPAHFIFFYLLSEILKNKNKTIDDILYYSILVLFIITNKITLILSFLLIFPLLKTLNLKKIILNKKTYLLICFLFLWLLKNLLTTGCLIYPIKKTCYDNLSWADLKEIENISLDSEVWSKGWPEYTNFQIKNDLPIESNKFLEKFNWVKFWSMKHFKYILKIILPYIIFILLFFLILKIFLHKKNYHESKNNYFAIFTLFLLFTSIIFWFVKSPIYRYGYSYIVSFLSLFSAIIFYKYFSKYNFKNIINIFFIIFFIIFFGKNSLRIYKNDNLYQNYPWPKYFSMKHNNQKPLYDSIKINNVKIYSPINGYCMYNKNLCMQYSSNLTKININEKNGYMIILKKVY